MNNNLLIVDDEYWVKENLKNLLNWDELKISLTSMASNGLEAIEIIKNENPDIIITDINMPLMNGNELIRFVKKFNPDIQVIVLSGYDDFNLVREALTEGAKDYILKPVNKNTLINTLEKIVLQSFEIKEQKNIEDRKNEQFLIASSIMRDNEYSHLLLKNTKANQNEVIVGLKFVFYTLINVKIYIKENDNLLSLEFRKILMKYVNSNNSIIFNNINRMNEFIVISDLKEKDIDLFCNRLILTISGNFNLPINIGISNQYYNFDSLYDAYKESVISINTINFCQFKVSVKYKNIKDKISESRISNEILKLINYHIKNNENDKLEIIICDILNIDNSNNIYTLYDIKVVTDYLINQVILNNKEKNFQNNNKIENLKEQIDLNLDQMNRDKVYSLLKEVIDSNSLQTFSGNKNMKIVVFNVQKYIFENYMNEISLTTIADHFKVEKTYLCKVYKKVLSKNLSDEIAEKRISEAVVLLETNKDLSLYDVAELVGYSDYNNFNKVFHKLRGISPSSFRNSLMKGKNLAAIL